MPVTDSIIATKLMHMDNVMLSLMVLTVAFDKRFRYETFEISSLIRAISAASTAISLPISPMATPTSAIFNAGASLTPSPIRKPRGQGKWLFMCPLGF